jgi:hypothetical protein
MGIDHESAFLEALQSVGLKPDLEKEAADSGVTAQNIWRHPDAHPVVLDFMLLQKYGVDWMTWEPETLETLIPKDFNTQTLSDLNMAKIQACKTLHFVDSFWERWEVFVWCTMAFNGVFPDFGIMQVPTVAQCMVSIDIASRLRDDIQFSHEIDVFLGVVHKHDGILVPQPPVGYLTTIEHDIELGIIQNVVSRWHKVRASKIPPKGDTIEDEQLRRMLVVHDFLEENRTRLRQQLRLVHA